MLGTIDKTKKYDRQLEQAAFTDNDRPKSYVKLGKNVKKLIQLSKMNIIDLCIQTGASRSTLAKILSGKPCNPTLKTLELLSDYFSIPVEILIGRRPFPENYQFGEYNPATVQMVRILAFTPNEIAQSTFEILMSQLRMSDKESQDVHYFETSAKHDPKSSFALTLDQKLTKLFFSIGMPWTRPGTSLIFSTEARPGYYDIVLAAPGPNQAPELRYYIDNGTSQYLEPLNKGLGGPEKIDAQAYILGTMIGIDLLPNEKASVDAW